MLLMVLAREILSWIIWAALDRKLTFLIVVITESELTTVSTLRMLEPGVKVHIAKLLVLA